MHQGTIQVFDPNVVYYSFAFKEAEVPDYPTNIVNMENYVKAVKILRNGQVLIRRGDKLYTMQGQEVE